MPPHDRSKLDPAFLHISPPHLNGEEWGRIREALESNWVAPVGPMLDAFEAAVAKSLGVDHAVGVSSGTAALHLALRLAGVGPGDVVLCPTFTFVGCVNPILYLGAEPLFLDSEEETWNLDPGLVAEGVRHAEAAGKRVRALLFADIYGQCAAIDSIRAYCTDRDIALVEDAAEALGATLQGRPAGSLGDVAALSFNGNKIITTSGGGMLLTNHRAWAEKARFWSTQAREPGPAYTHRELGYNYRLSNILAALGLAQWESLEDRVVARRRIFARYREGLGNLPGVTFMPEPSGHRATHWLSCLRVDPAVAGIDALAIREGMLAASIEARLLWQPLHTQPLFAGSKAVGGAVAERLFREGISLPSGSNLQPEEQDRVIACFLNLLR